MPQTEVRFYKDDKGVSPVIEWLLSLADPTLPVRSKCDAALKDLREQGYELHRPTSDSLRDGIHELRFHVGRVHHRVLYFFHPTERNVAIITHHLTKEGVVPDKDVERAVSCMKSFEQNPDAHTFTKKKVEK